MKSKNEQRREQREAGCSAVAEIDLTGPDGNVFVLMGQAKSFARQLGYNSKEITDDMMSSNYEHAVAVFEKWFGNFCIVLK